MYEQNALMQSLAYNQEFVWPNIHVGYRYEKLGNSEKSCIFFEKALKNVETVYKANDTIDILNIDRFIDEYLKGTYLSSMNFEEIKKRAAHCTKKH